ncbi:mechanosensitive ion channel family protein [Bosea sp. 2YAB26]|uniref:mechanosensitive ion channel family protein n=1 Tax=Bosea sp. 2YAB26 TaxID=3237478 RepID=UPI003F93DBA1
MRAFFASSRGHALPAALVLLAFLLIGSGSAAFAQASGDNSVTLILRGDEAPDALRKTITTLEAGGRKVILRMAGPGEAVATAPAAAATPVKPAPAETRVAVAETRLEEVANHFVEGFDYGNASIPSATRIPSDWARAWAANQNGATGMSAGARVLLVLFAATAFAVILWKMTRGLIAKRLVPRDDTLFERFVASSIGFAHDFAALVALWLAGRTLVRWLLPQLDFAQHIATAELYGLGMLWSFAMAGRFLLSPGNPARRILPLPRAERHFGLIMIYAFFGHIVLVVNALGEGSASDPASIAGWFAVSSLLLTAYKVWWFWYARHDLVSLAQPGPSASGLRRLVAAATPWLLMASAVLIWAVGRSAAVMPDGAHWGVKAGTTQFIVVLAPIVASGLGALIRSWLNCRSVEREQTPLSSAMGRTLQSSVVGFVWLCALYLLVRLWSGFVMDADAPDTVSFGQRLLSVASLAFMGWIALTFLRAFFDAYTPRAVHAGPTDEEAPPDDHVPSRLGTVLPVLRGVVLGAVIGLTSLVVLSRLGVDIGPLLAGFGILGLAVSFGSQALVRDIVSGFFFMVEDAFRVGEYVDTGRLKGTVEKISLRSVQLRHQSGQIHTVPFGQIPSLTNASRDWATVKFNVRLDRSADIEKARKTIKKIGLALLEDPEFGPHFIAQLKMQGVAEIADTAIVIRLKFTAKPAQAGALQREALKRMYQALNDAGVAFASNAVTVRGGEGQASAGAAASITTIQPPTPLAPSAG